MLTTTNRAAELKKRATELSGVLRLVDNADTDLAPAANRVLLSGATLPGYNGSRFDGEAVFQANGEVLTLGVRRSSSAGVSEILINRQGTNTQVSERSVQGPGVVMTAVALFNMAGDLLSYEETF